MPKASAFGKAGHAQLRRGLLLLHLIEHPPHENPGYAPVENTKTKLR